LAFTDLKGRLGDVSRLIAGSDPTQHETRDLPLYYNTLAAFLPDQIVDAHVHLWDADCLAEPIAALRYATTMLEAIDGFSAAAMTHVYEQLLPGKRVDGVYFGLAAYEADADRVNQLVAAESSGVAARLLIPPRGASYQELERILDRCQFKGFKPYPEHARHLPLDDVQIDDFATDAQWCLADERQLAILLHLPRPRRLADPVNLAGLEERLNRHPHARVVLAHLGATACDRGLADSFGRLSHYPNVFFDTALVSNAGLMSLVLETAGPSRLVFGTDLPFALVRGKRTCVDGQSLLLTQEPYHFAAQAETPCTYLVFETLLAIKQAAERMKLTADEVRMVFYDNARTIYGDGKPQPHRPGAEE